MGASVLDVIMKRRSIRRFTGDSLKKDDIEIMLKAAMAAPSAYDRKPWEFLVITDREKIKTVCEAHPYAKFGVLAGALIVPFGDRSLLGQYYFFQDMAAATENMLIAIAGLGLGATWCGMNEERHREIHPILGLPDSKWVFALVPVGVPAVEKPSRTQYDENKVHWEVY